MGHIEGVERNQKILLQDAVDDYIEDNNSVRFIDAFIDSLDLLKLGFKHAEPESTGRPPYNPSDLLKLYIYGYLNRIRSSRCLEKETQRNVELMWLLRKLTPDFKTIADFRKDNKKAIKAVCREFILLCKHLDLFGSELIAIDGSKFQAVNSKKRNFNKDKLKKKINEIEERIETYISELDENDRKEKDILELNVEELRKKIELLKERKEKYEELLKGLGENGKTQVSLTDPDSRAMVNNQKIEVCYNVQTTVDSKHKLILDYEVTNEIKDSKELNKMSNRAKGILGVNRLEVLADKGYYDARKIKECIDNGITPYIPQPKPTVSKKIDVPKVEFYENRFIYDRKKDVYICPGDKELTFRNKAVHHSKLMRLYKSKECLSCPLKRMCTRNPKGRIIYRWEDEDILEKMQDRVNKEKEKVKLRNLLVEHIFGTIKRNWGYGYFLMRGKENVSVEMGLTVLAYNLKRVLNILGLKRLIGLMKVINKGTSDDLVANFGDIFAKIRDFIYRWLKLKHKEAVYA